MTIFKNYILVVTKVPRKLQFQTLTFNSTNINHFNEIKVTLGMVGLSIRILRFVDLSQSPSTEFYEVFKEAS